MQESKQEPRFTIFARWNDNSYRQGGECFFPPLEGEPKSLADRIEYVRNFMGLDSFVPFAWWTSSPSGFLGFDEEIAAAVAAGRLIEQVDGKWIARGLNSQPTPIEPDCFDKAHAAVISEIDRLANAAMIARDDTAAAHEWRERQLDAYIERQNFHPLITTKPPIAGLTRVSAQDHRVGGWGFVR